MRDRQNEIMNGNQWSCDFCVNMACDRGLKIRHMQIPRSHTQVWYNSITWKFHYQDWQNKKVVVLRCFTSVLLSLGKLQSLIVINICQRPLFITTWPWSLGLKYGHTRGYFYTKIIGKILNDIKPQVMSYPVRFLWYECQERASIIR